MPLDSSAVVQFTASSTAAAAAASSFVVTLPSGTTAGNTVVIGIALVGGGTAITTPTGFVKDVSLSAGCPHYVFRRSNVPAAETSWTLSMTSLTARAAWWVMEIAGLDLDDPVDGTASSSSNVSPQTSGTVSTNSALDTIVLASHAGNNSAAAAPTWSGQTNGFVELVEAATSATANVDIAVSTLIPGTIGPFECSATESVASTSNGLLVVYKSATSLTASALVYHTGFEFGHGGGLATGPVAARIATTFVGTLGTNVIVQSGSAKNGTYGLRVVCSASTGGVAWTSVGPPQVLPSGKSVGVVGFWLRVVSATGTVIVAEVREDSTNYLHLVYDAATAKLGLRWNAAGTISYQAGTTALNTWTRLDIAAWGYKSTTRTASWYVDGGQETAPADRTGQLANGSFGQIIFGSVDTAVTYTADYDDLRISNTKGNHPLGDQRVTLVGVDPAGTVTLSGTTTNFQTFAGATPTLTAWNATTARDAVDEVPPTLGASANGAAQVAAAAADYMQFPMSTYTLANGEMIVGVQALVAGWAAGASVIGLRGYDGTTETVLWAAADPSFNNSATAPGWLSKSWYPGGRWTQTRLDAAALRLGFGTSATDIGAHALYLEVAVGAAASYRVAEATGLESVTGSATVDAYLDDATGSVVSYTASAPPEFDAVVSYNIRGVPTSTTVPAGSTDVEIVDADTAADVTDVTIGPA